MRGCWAAAAAGRQWRQRRRPAGGIATWANPRASASPHKRLIRPHTCSSSTESFVLTALAPRHCCS
jgi:hypothetical protein